MAHEFVSGFTVREASWHGLEDVLDEAPASWDEGRLAAGMMWEPRLVPLYYVNAAGEYVEHANGKRVERDDNGEACGTGTVSGTFELITHEEMGRIMEPVLDQPGCRLDTMGVLSNSGTVYATVLLDEPYTIPGDVDGYGDPVATLPYFAVMNSHDGTGACKGLFTQVRIVCKNTVQASAADGDRHGAQFSLRHTSGVKARLDDARDVVKRCREEAARWREIAAELVAEPITDEQQEEFAERFIAMPATVTVTDRVKANVLNDRANFMFVLRESATNTAMQHNALGLFNAAVEYADHVRRAQSRDTLIKRQIMRAEPLKTGALKLVRELVSAS